MTGQVVSHYQVLNQIGAGGMGLVYEAKDLRLGRKVALKILPPELSREPAAVERFHREAETISSLNHPHICTLYDVGEHEGRQFLVFELVEGRALKEMIGAAPLSIPTVLRLSIGVADALEATHTWGIVHRDVKPGNILVTERGDAKLTDFGIATLEAGSHAAEAATREHVTAPGSLIGTPEYMAPEQLRGEPADARSDLFALGAVMFEMATGKSHAASSQSPSRLNAKVPPELSRIILKALEKDPALRYQTAKELLADLRRLADTGIPDAIVQAARFVRKAWKDGKIIAASAVFLFSLIGAVWWWASRGTDTKQASAAPVIDLARLVVLPFENLTRRPDEDWLAGAFSDSVSAGLQPIASLILVPRERVVELYASESRRDSSALSADLARQLSEKLRVRYYVHGSYQRVGDELRIVARLVDLTADAIQAQETLTGPFADVLRLEETLATRFAMRLSPGTTSQNSDPRPAVTSNFEAYQLVTEARRLYALGRFGEAKTLLQKSVRLDPGYAFAWAMLAKSNARLWSPAVGSGRPSANELTFTLDAATKAVTLDRNAVESHIAAALAYRGLEDRARWRGAANQAVAVDPRHGEARITLADTFAMSPGFGCPDDPRPEAAEATFREGLRIDPLFASGYVNLTTHRWWMGRRVEALAAMDEGLAMIPGNAFLSAGRSFNLFFADRVDEADTLLKQRLASAANLTPLERLTLGFIALRRQRFEEAAAQFSRRELDPTRMNLAFSMIAAVGYFEAGRAAEGAAHLARAIAAEPECAEWARLAPALMPFRATPEFARVLRR